MDAKSDRKYTFRLKSLLQFYRGQGVRFAGAAAFTVAGAALSLLTPLVFRFIIDTVLDGKEPELPAFLLRLFTGMGGQEYFLRNIWILGLVIVGIHAVDGLLNFCKGRWSSIIAESGARSMRKTLYSHIQSLPFAYHATAETGDLVQRCTSDVDTVRRFLNGQVYEIIRCFCLVVASITFMLMLDLRMALVSMASTPFIFLSAFLYFRRQRDAAQKWDEAEGDLSTMLQESMTGIRVVKAFARQDHERSKFEGRNQTLRRCGKEFIRLMSNFWMYSDFICLLQIGITTVVGVVYVVGGRISLGMMIVFTGYTEMLLYPLRGLARMLSDAGRTQISFGRLQEIMDTEAEPSDEGLEDIEAAGRIRFDNVSFAYKGNDRDILRGVTFEVNPGETIGVLGPTGSGKSTIMYLLQRLYDPTGGTLSIDGRDITGISRRCMRRNVGFVLQEPFVFSRTIFENIRMPRPDAPEQMVYDASRAAAIHDDIESFEEGYQTMVGERGVTLSGGQKQRVTIARTLIRECPILVFDDSLSAVDTETDARIRSELAGRRRRATTFIISHRIATLADTDRILVVEDGRITQQGSHAELLAQQGLYRRVYDIQNALSDIEETEGNL
ncbi:MAG: ABC transporter ATP-binding protein [Clostridia bacterium]|nr:ABC transporter ATP-binding protein [Clostridia bacterium]